MIELLKDVIGCNFKVVKYVKAIFHKLCKTKLAMKFSFVSLDADLYQPILSRLLYSFYPRLAPGGLIFVHDYGSHNWDGCKAVDEFLEQQKRLHVYNFTR